MRSEIGDLLTPREMADLSGWSVKSIRKLLTQRRIRHVKRGNRYLIPKTAISEFLASNMVEPEGAANKLIPSEATGDAL
ncbi:MAG: DNA-binding protein [Erythrobacter sp.]|jgi:DNA binding domain, excisionase family|nr:DNA-binding protein [Erythrobacter sp.]MBA4052842.1 DNA-binding protein [Erythrobacter sp.]MBA4174488.1 DNA-binding protein [Hyphomicrobium sp.]